MDNGWWLESKRSGWINQNREPYRPGDEREKCNREGGELWSMRVRMEVLGPREETRKIGREGRVTAKEIDVKVSEKKKS